VQPDGVMNAQSRELTEAAPMADGGAGTASCVHEERSGTCLYSRGRSVSSL
jgi:glycerate kinase